MAGRRGREVEGPLGSGWSPSVATPTGAKALYRATTRAGSLQVDSVRHRDDASYRSFGHTRRLPLRDLRLQPCHVGDLPRL
jgi:hypothetical protein